MATVEENATKIDLLSQRMLSLATSNQVSTLESMITSWQNQVSASLVDIQNRLDSLESNVSDLLRRVNDLENA